MSAKTSAARRAAFFEALRATGNQTLAAERAKVSRSWVQLQRSSGPAFKDAVRAAVAEARASLSQRSATSAEHGAQSGRQPPSGWGHLDGEELVVKGTGGSSLGSAQGGPGGRRVQIARARLRQWTPRIEARFLTALMATCNVKAACIEVGMSAAGPMRTASAGGASPSSGMRRSARAIAGSRSPCWRTDSTSFPRPSCRRTRRSGGWTSRRRST